MAGRKIVSALAIGLGGIVLWGSSRMPWLHVEAFDDKSGAKQVDMLGATWSTETTAVALVLIAACVAILVLRRAGRRFVALVSAVAAAGGLWAPVQLLFNEPDATRALNILTSHAATGHAKDGAALTGWAEITHISVQAPSVILAMCGAGFALIAAIISTMNPGEDSVQKSRFERQQARNEKIESELEEAPDSGRVLWDAIDADIDPTDR
ncbi:TIGR02234 family membrane protein [Corynebacterium belfantii]|uniref:TIGR02234 family membrane protein n=1 Tax=Corynebacterium belfantii TaxID=2014537 RepID=A0ABS0LE79_9CORY|nr:TIGR02234 family membrane protein [Corynebacterium belfantii]OWM37252.1 hypothetical protein AZF07_07140 [Corynebacterium diphtheriae subsp. lausannense]STC67149.1 hypothetical membrane protein [Corynebacterium diphtheriae]MBG9243091.1 TIGR02234 family membrane protein [Corynebacterium belfantii]MBG9286657.1 TIGR02234 family membrane protein [Corynebacterium belfantii]MBG9318612.1 TIGR02234 family membrane protein [Corynebacterium belfantii]